MWKSQCPGFSEPRLKLPAGQSWLFLLSPARLQNLATSLSSLTSINTSGCYALIRPFKKGCIITAGTLMCIRENALALAAFSHFNAVLRQGCLETLGIWHASHCILLEHMQFTMHRNICNVVPPQTSILNIFCFRPIERNGSRHSSLAHGRSTERFLVSAHCLIWVSLGFSNVSIDYTLIDSISGMAMMVHGLPSKFKLALLLNLFESWFQPYCHIPLSSPRTKLRGLHQSWSYDLPAVTRWTI